MCPGLCNASYGNVSLATNPYVYSSKPIPMEDLGFLCRGFVLYEGGGRGFIII